MKKENNNTGDYNTGNRNTGDWNTGDWNTGNYNTGDYNTGYWNTGDYNTGNYNTGDYNTGNYNTGDYNTGYYNTGNYNTGYYNTGNRNTGYCNNGDYNTGYWNTGNRNTGNWNTGDYNTGNRNTGNRNTGDWNKCNYETGYFNTEQSDKIRVFNKDYSRKEWHNTEKPNFLYFKLTEWVYASDMSEAEKKEHPSYETTGGYLKEYEYKEAFKKSWDNASAEDRALLFKLPNFDAEIFKEISGIDVSAPDNTDKIEELKKAQQELIKKAQEIQEQIEGLQ
jgi:hypothetical protein